MSRLSQWNIKLGDFFFRFRNALFPAVYAILLLTTRPKIMFGDETWYQVWLWGGAAIAILGQLFRLLTIGYEYIERGGKEGKVYATFLVQGGVYAHTRNPMYVGNGLMAIGLIMYSGSPVACLVGIPFFLLVYQSITVAEENYLRSKFGQSYAEYCQQVNRFIPSLGGLVRALRPLRFDWKRSLRKEFGTVMVLALGLILLPLWREAYIGGFAHGSSYAPRAVVLTSISLLIYLAILFLKKSKRLECSSS